MFSFHLLFQNSQLSCVILDKTKKKTVLQEIYLECSKTFNDTIGMIFIFVDFIDV